MTIGREILAVFPTRPNASDQSKLDPDCESRLPEVKLARPDDLHIFETLAD
jgi:hypothetical protein